MLAYDQQQQQLQFLILAKSTHIVHHEISQKRQVNIIKLQNISNRYNQEYLIMKAHSPAHRMIQLRRKTEKIAIPKMSWDLNKENSNLTNIYEASKSKNNSSKKNSLERKCEMKKTLSATQNLLKCTIKKISKNQMFHKDKKQLSLQKGQKKTQIQKKEAKLDSSCSDSHLIEDMNRLLKRAKRKQPTSVLKLNYKALLSNASNKKKCQSSLVNTMREHIEFWIQRCQSLQSTLSMMCDKTPKLQNNQDLQQSRTHQEERANTEDFDSSISMCSYIVDPKEQVKMKPIKKQLRQKLQLNFQKVDYFRKKQF